MSFNSEHIKTAYLYLKGYAYNENLNLFLKQRIAEFEKGSNELDDIFEAIACTLNSEDCFESEALQTWLNKIDFHLLPKTVTREEDHFQNKQNKENGLFISNVRDSEKYETSKLNYFINAPIELHIVETLWCLFVGSVLDLKLSKDCYGNRMHSSSLKFATNQGVPDGHEVFMRYIDQYNLWRDQALEIATDITKKGDDTAFLSLDLKSYFYNVDLNFDKITAEINSHYQNSKVELNLAHKLNKLLKIVYSQYKNVINPSIKLSHPESKDKTVLPIGFASSSIIANWYLAEFDTCIADEVRPSFYGRYVDDIIMVFKRPKFDSQNPIPSFVSTYLARAFIRTDDDSEYQIDVNGNFLPLQKEKLILQFFDKNHSQAGLEVFKQELDERSSAFKFLPTEHIEKDLDRFAYDVLYNGSANKLRSIVGLAENETELAKYLATHISAQRLCKLDKKDVVAPQLKQFFKGQNALQFFRLWEKLFQYSIITKNYDLASFFHNYINEEIGKINFFSEQRKTNKRLSSKLKNDLLIYNQLSLAITLGLLDLKPESEFLLFIDPEQGIFLKSKPGLNKLFENNLALHTLCINFRRSNLIRHHLVAWPLANFANTDYDLTSEEDFINDSAIHIDEHKVEYSPRFIHFDEWQIFHLGKYLDSGEYLNNWITKTIDDYKDKFFGDDRYVIFVTENDDSSNIVKSSLKIGGNDQKDNLKLAIANLQLAESDIESSVRNDSKPNVSYERQKSLYNLLNSALKENADLLVMPEVAIPVSWLPFMIAFSRRHQIGLIFGLEHWVSCGVAYNLIIEALPFKVDGKYKSCAMTARIKNHYAPSELDLLEKVRLTPGNALLKPKAFYHKVSWRGVAFSTYNCFELSDVSHRVLFKSEIDLLFACVWNKDTNYYQHILESTVRDLHCYTVQANTSQYGGSCVLQPTQTERKTMLYVKGGENSTVLTTKLDIKKLRKFQYQSKPGSKDYFKHLPPGYDSESVLKR